jgi:2-keto-4-pentenoate hydratase
MTFDPERAAGFVASAHAARAPYRNLPEEIAPRSLPEAYAAQEALAALWSPLLGPVAGAKIATTTRVMQDLMGIDHPCGGMIFKSRIHATGATVRLSDFQHMVVECELAVAIARDVDKSDQPYTRDTIRPFIAGAMAAFELIEDRHAHYTSTSALSLIADNAWNGGIVIGQARALSAEQVVDGIAGRLLIDGVEAHAGKTDDPLGALAWVANLGIARGRPLRAGHVVITGSVIPTLPIAPGQTFTFSLDGVGEAQMTAA